MAKRPDSQCVQKNFLLFHLPLHSFNYWRLMITKGKQFTINSYFHVCFYSSTNPQIQKLSKYNINFTSFSTLSLILISNRKTKINLSKELHRDEVGNFPNLIRSFSHYFYIISWLLPTGLSNSGVIFYKLLQKLIWTYLQFVVCI